MKIKSCQVSNFASYKELDFDFTNKSLSLIQGPTGSGKSTFCDIIPWVLYGKTAKSGSVDEVLSWNADEWAFGRVFVETQTHILEVLRIRAHTGSKEFYFIRHDHVHGDTAGPVRGKDNADTQRLLNEALGVPYEVYLSGAYFHEFSQTAGFFTSAPKARRAICEQIIDLSLAKNLQSKLSEEKKTVLTKVEKIRNDLYTLKSNIEFTEKNIDAAHRNEAKWEDDRSHKYNLLIAKSDNFSVEQEETIKNLNKKQKAFEADRNAKIQELNNRLKQATACPVCIKNKASFEKDIRTAFALDNPYAEQIIRENARKNTYREQAKILNSLINPHQVTIAQQNEQMASLVTELEKHTSSNSDSETKLVDIEQLSEVVVQFRSTLAQQTIQNLQGNTNDLLSRHFDGEIQVEFIVEDSDKLEISISKDGHQCVYSQLSKGQRQLLKLCFGLSVMRQVTNHYGVIFNAIFLDEALDGLDDSFKVKAFNLLQELELEYESIFVVEHSESLKALFNNRFSVSSTNGVSTLHEES